MDLRKPFIDTLIANDDGKSVFITLDVGFSFLEPLKDKFGDRFINLGITEQSAIVTASALARDYRVYVYSMIPFVLFRPFEMVRNTILIPKANVKLLGVKGSAAYAMLGFSHNMVLSDEDVRLVTPYGVKATVLEDEQQATLTALETLNNVEPHYVRL
jgi:transketolase